MGKGYYVGLDMGTGSVGWAVTDESYQILRRHGKAMWGVRLFESAKTAEERRMFRTGRRRLDRRGWRIEILQEIFAEEISRVDPGFFLRMKESKYYPEDKRNPAASAFSISTRLEFKLCHVQTSLDCIPSTAKVSLERRIAIRPPSPT